MKNTKPCSCGCGTCNDKNPSGITLNESIAPKQILSEGLKYHLKHNKPLTEHLYRAGSKKYFELWAEARALYSRGIIEINNPDDLEILTEMDLGEYGYTEEGKKVPLDFPMEEQNNMLKELIRTSLNEKACWKGYKQIGMKTKNGKKVPNCVPIKEGIDDLSKKGQDLWKEIVANDLFGKSYIDLSPKQQMEVHNELDDFRMDESKIDEAEYQGRDVDLNDPKRGGSKAYYVYVNSGKKTKEGEIKAKKVSFGSSMRAKLSDPDARNAYSERHNCDKKKDRTTAGYWSCRLPRFAKSLGFSKNYSGYW